MGGITDASSAAISCPGWIPVLHMSTGLEAAAILDAEFEETVNDFITVLRSAPSRLARLDFNDCGGFVEETPSSLLEFTALEGLYHSIESVDGPMWNAEMLQALRHLPHLTTLHVVCAEEVSHEMAVEILPRVLDWPANPL